MKINKNLNKIRKLKTLLIDNSLIYFYTDIKPLLPVQMSIKEKTHICHNIQHQYIKNVLKNTILNNYDLLFKNSVYLIVFNSIDAHNFLTKELCLLGAKLHNNIYIYTKSSFVYATEILLLINSLKNCLTRIYSLFSK